RVCSREIVRRGRGGGTRTRDLLLPKQARYQAALRPVEGIVGPWPTPFRGITAVMPGGVERSNLDKVFWPDAGLTKGDLLRYFEAVAPFVLPPLRGRPLTVIRFPDGIGKFSFYQKDTPKYA